MWKLRASDIEYFRKIRPTTHEIGGTLSFDTDGYVSEQKMSAGGKCRAATGELLTNATNCSVRHYDGPCVFHTHPRANRPSSGDLLSSIQGYPRRKKNIIFTPLGVWVFSPTQKLAANMSTYSTTERRRQVKAWRYIGHMEQVDTQADRCRGMQAALHNEGFNNKYIPYKSVTTGTEWTL